MTNTSATARDYLPRAAAALRAAADLNTIDVTREEHEHAQRLADYAQRCAEVALHAADAYNALPGDHAIADTVWGLADATRSVATSIRHTRLAATA